MTLCIGVVTTCAAFCSEMSVEYLPVIKFHTALICSQKVNFEWRVFVEQKVPSGHREERGIRHILKKDTKLLSGTLKRLLCRTIFVVRFFLLVVFSWCENMA